MFEKVTERTIFTTQRKKPKTSVDICRKGSIVKERCKQLSEVALGLFPNRIISDVDLKDLVMMYIGCDKETVRSYTGYYGHIRQGKCGDNQVVGLSRKGYLELLGFMHKIGHGRWLIHAQVTLQETVSSPPTYKEGVSSGFDSKEKIYLSPSGSACRERQALEDTKGVAISKLEEEEAIEKERNFTPKIYGETQQKPRLSGLETAILYAKPTAADQDRSKVDWGVQE